MPTGAGSGLALAGMTNRGIESSPAEREATGRPPEGGLIGIIPGVQIYRYALADGMTIRI